ncbi:NB-ARC domain-containing protein [Streptomyces sp. UG1]|uniref:NB-ARC domain-containing protein n=1 Tax=Streptomyces sp. UG1 TaxID=3417652 RepID=UPI003CE84892
MGRPEKPLAPDAGPATVFARELRRLRVMAGSPSYRELAKRALFSASVLSDAAAGHRLPTLQVALAFAEACGGDRATWERRWREAARHHDDGRRPAAQPVHRVRETRLRAVARAVLPTPAQLPMERRPLAGRDERLRQARVLTALGTATAAPLVIHGQVGVGKSAFALRLARELAVGLSDGQLYVNLEPAADGRKDAAGIAGGVLRALGVAQEHVPDDPVQRVGLYRSLLHERRLLVVFDGVRHERQVRELLAATPHSRIVLTARGRLLGLDGVRRLRLPVLDRDGSMALLADVIGGERLRAAPRAGLALAEACGDLPLALNLAGRKLAARPEARLDEAVAELIDGDGPLARLRVGDESLTERLEDVYRRLTPWARLVLRQFAGAKLRPSVDTVAYESVTALARSLEPVAEPVEDLLESLVDSGVLERTDVPGQYGLPPLVREFVLSQSDPMASASLTEPARTA